MKKQTLLLAACGLLFGLGGCLNDDERFDDFGGSPAIVQIPTTANFGITDNQGLPIQTGPVSYSFNVTVNAPSPAGQDVVVTLGVDANALKAYNTANGTNYVVLPTNLYQLPATTTTIRAGQRYAPVTINFLGTSTADPTAYNNAGYALPVTVTGATGATVGGNYATKIIVVKIKNRFDGTYRATGTFTHPVNGARKIDRDKTLTTVDGASVTTEFADLGGSGWTMTLRVNADNSVTLVPTGAASTGTVQFGVNRYDPATRTYTLNYRYAGGGGDRVINELIKVQ
jgi:hypothetical protein